MNYIKDLRTECGGTENIHGVFKRNKRDIKKEYLHQDLYEHKNYNFILKDAYGYNKALVYIEKENPEHEILVSYNTIVAERIDNEIKINGWYSRTTAEHINTYLGKYTGRTYCKKDLEKEPVIEWY